MKFIKVEVDVLHIGKEFARSDDHHQAAILNAMGSELIVTCREKFEMQCCYLSDRLDKNGAELIKKLAEFIYLRESTKAD